MRLQLLSKVKEIMDLTGLDGINERKRRAIEILKKEIRADIKKLETCPKEDVWGYKFRIRQNSTALKELEEGLKWSG